MHKIVGVPRDYDWGSTTLIQAVLGLEPDGRHMAELWFGAHPTGPSPLDPPADGATTLEALIAAHPVVELGDRPNREFGHTLPFLMKLLAPAKAVSLQVHPSIANAQAGFARENAEGLALNAPNRSFKDSNHKPEMVFAITEFDGLVGFRELDATIALLNGYRGLKEIAQDLAADPSPEGMQRCLRALVELPSADVDVIVAEAQTLATDATPRSPHATVAELAEAYPGDAGVVASLVLNRVAFAPGQCIFVPSGMPHAYIGGLAVEIMANSDNVFRAGLTSKYVDLDGLMDNVAFRATGVELLAGEDVAPGVRVLRPDAREFQLTEVALKGATSVLGRGPRIALCTRGTAQVRSAHDEHPIALTPGQAVFLGDKDGDLYVDGAGQIVIAGVPTLRI